MLRSTRDLRKQLPKCHSTTDHLDEESRRERQQSTSYNTRKADRASAKEINNWNPFHGKVRHILIDEVKYLIMGFPERLDATLKGTEHIEHYTSFMQNVSTNTITQNHNYLH